MFANLELAMKPMDFGAHQSALGPQDGLENKPGRDDRAAALSSANELQSQEENWIREIANGNRSSFERLFHAYYRRIFGFLLRLVGRADAAEELTNDVMMGVWKGAAGFKGDSKVSTWIFGIAHFRAVSWLRRSSFETIDIDDAGPLKDPHELKEESLLRESTREGVRRALAKLTPAHREVIELTFYQEFSYPEIAAILSCPVNTVKTRMFYARKELRELLEERSTA